VSFCFGGRAVRYLVTEAGVRQFLDLGSGIPAADNTHEVAQAVALEGKIVYVDNDPIVLAHARALLTSTAGGKCAYLDADLRYPGKILEEAARTLDFTQPIGVLFIGVMHLVADSEDPYGVVARTVAATVPGSYLALTQPAADVHPEVVAEGARRYNENVKTPQTRRTGEETLRFFDGMELVPPGVVQCHRWHPNPGSTGLEADVACWAGVARKLQARALRGLLVRLGDHAGTRWRAVRKASCP
jgi:hypothetical protein